MVRENPRFIEIFSRLSNSKFSEFLFKNRSRIPTSLDVEGMHNLINPFLVQYSRESYKFTSWKYLCITRTSRQENRISFDFHGYRSSYNFLSCSFHYWQEMQVFCRWRNKNKRNVYKNMRARLQSKGTLSAKRMIKHLAGKEQIWWQMLIIVSPIQS